MGAICSHPSLRNNLNSTISSFKEAEDKINSKNPLRSWGKNELKERKREKTHGSMSVTSAEYWRVLAIREPAMPPPMTTTLFPISPRFAIFSSQQDSSTSQTTKLRKTKYMYDVERRFKDPPNIYSWGSWVSTWKACY